MWEGGRRRKRDLKPVIRTLWKARGCGTAAAGKRRACGWRKEAKVKPCAERRRETLGVPGEAPAPRAAARAGCGPHHITGPPPRSLGDRPNLGTRSAGLFALAGNRQAKVLLGTRRAGTGSQWLQLLWRPAPLEPPPRHSHPAPGWDRTTGAAEGLGAGESWNHHRFYLEKKKKAVF